MNEMQHSKPRLFVDADACPVKAECERVAERHRLEMIVVSNGGIRPSRNPLVRNVIVPPEPDAADDWIAENARSGDVIVTNDIPLASRGLAIGARVIRANGQEFSNANIGNALAGREMAAHMREVTGEQGRNAGFTPKDRSRFLSALEVMVQAVLRG
ncbi:YaiI/YqxD family protein [Thalassospira sp.]|uniref:YaiI/YqxD family protein n=1 Tax=Thalassospira sp. TaxID=1912094 RepID=UPI0027342EED|nr:YaiI/YqxD family protein [Thalassospira sp.]MDP2697521.1 YaiI/YqxD family protein [Thalassospira sp.]